MTDPFTPKEAITLASYVKMRLGDLRVRFSNDLVTLWDALRGIDNEAKTGRNILNSLSAFGLGSDDAKDVLTAMRIPLYLHAYIEAHEDKQIEQVFSKAEIGWMKGFKMELEEQIQFITDALSNADQSDHSEEFNEAYDFEEGEWFYYIVDRAEILLVK